MTSIRPVVLRRGLPWVGGLAFVIVLLVATWRIVGTRGATIERERARIQEFVESEVTTWEEDLLADLREHLETAAANPSLGRILQTRLRQTHGWLDSVYIWELQPDGNNVMLFPGPPAVASREYIQSRPCIQQAEAYKREEPLDHLKVARAYILGCRFERHPIVKVQAATEAAYLLRYLRLPEQGLQALEMADVPPNATLLELTRRGLPPGHVAPLRFARAGLLLDLGRTDQALDELAGVGRQITELDAPDLGMPLNTYLLGESGIVGILRSNGRPEQALQLDRLAQRASRRLEAYHEVRKQILGRSPDPGAEPRFIRDQYSDNDPYLLYFGWSQGHGVALQLEQDALVDEFLAERLRPYRHHVTILGERDQWLAGARRGGDFAFTVPFSKSLGHLRVGVRESALDAAMSNTNEQTAVLLVIVVACALLGFVALWTQVRLARQQAELVHRQRAFTMRVTHELKTPLAGIKVMAENIESGAFRGDEQRSDMARRIVEEADRLTSRVDDVLAVARQRTIPSPERYDPEEAILAAVDQWGPRLEDAGVKLHADLHATEEVLGDSDALRDAVGCLLDNALKYRHEDRAAEVWLELFQDGRHVVIDVSDNGIGVPRPMRRAIFQRFVRVEGPNRGKAGGHGLGLTQVREIVEAHGGTVQCTDGVGGGARFLIRIPALQVASA